MLSEIWSGGYFELGMEFDRLPEARLCTVRSAMWEHASLHGCYASPVLSNREGCAQKAAEFEISARLFGIADIPQFGDFPCVSWAVPSDDGSNWLGLGVPMKALGTRVGVGAYPFDDGSDLSWRPVIQDWLRDIATTVHEFHPFTLGLIEHNATGDVSTEAIARDGIPEKRWLGYLWPEAGFMKWYPPTEGAPFQRGA